MTITPGQKVRHIVTSAEHDIWVGYVVRVCTEETATSKVVRVDVRWIKPDGNPSDGTTTCDPAELVVI